MAEPMSALSPQKVNSIAKEEDEASWHEPPSSPFLSFVDQDQENVPPVESISTPSKPSIDSEENVPQSAFKVASPSKSFGFKYRMSPHKTSPTKHVAANGENEPTNKEIEERDSPLKKSPVKQLQMERPGSAMSASFRSHRSPSKESQSTQATSDETTLPGFESPRSTTPEANPVVLNRPAVEETEHTLRDNEGLTVAMKIMESRTETRSETLHTSTEYTVENTDVNFDDTDFNPDGPDFTSADVDDTCFSNFSEMPNLDMTKFAMLRGSPTKTGSLDHATPHARAQMTPSTIRRTSRTPSPTPRRTYKENDTTNLLLDFTAQMESFSLASQRASTRRQSPAKPSDSGLLSYIQNQRSPAKGSGYVPSTPTQGRQVFNLLDFELPPPPTPRSVPTVTIRELESLKSSFQSQVSSLTASLSGKEAEVESLVKAVSDAERRVGEAQEALRDERSAREHAELQMSDWKKKGEEVQKLLQDVQANLNRNDEERELLMQKLAAAELRIEEAENRASDAEARAIEAESKAVDMTTFVDTGLGEGKKFTEEEVQGIVAEKINEVARDLHAAYKAKHEKKIAALKGNYQRKSDEKIKEFKDQVTKLEKQVEELQNSRDDTFERVVPANFVAVAQNANASNTEDKKRIEAQQTEIQNLNAKLAGLMSELECLKKSHAELTSELEVERVEKGELVAAAEQMLLLCGEKMDMKGEELGLGRSQMGGAPPMVPSASASVRSMDSALGSSIGSGAAGLGVSGRESASGIGRPSGLRGPRFGAHSRSGSAGAGGPGKSRLMSNIERMGARSAAGERGAGVERE